jgi:dienelactone hydrolase
MLVGNNRTTHLLHCCCYSFMLHYSTTIISSDWDGNNAYEQERATYFADMGYVGFAADVYGADKLNVTEISERITLATQYRSNATLFVQRIERAIQEVQAVPECDGSQIALAGYCLGGTGTVLYAFSDRDDVKVRVADRNESGENRPLEHFSHSLIYC